MDRNQLKSLIVSSNLTVLDAMAQIDKNEKGIVYVVDDIERLCGCLTDGDVRRWILNSGSLKAKITDTMFGTPKFIFESDRDRVFEIMSQNSITSIPVLDNNYCIVDVELIADHLEKIKIGEKKKKNLRGVPVVIMAGGKGTRLYPYTKVLPKPLIPIGDTPIMERVIEGFLEYGVNKFYVTVNYKKNMIRSYFSDSMNDYNIEFVEENQPLGTGGSIKLIEEKFSTPIIVTNCDIIIRTDYESVYKHHIKMGNDITVVSSLKNIEIPYGVMNAGKDGIILSMEEKPKMSCFINSGMYIINPELVDSIPDNQLYHMTDLISDVMNSGGRVGMYPISEDSFLDMGQFDEMRRMEEKLRIH